MDTQTIKFTTDPKFSTIFRYAIEHNLIFDYIHNKFQTPFSCCAISFAESMLTGLDYASCSPVREFYKNELEIPYYEGFKGLTEDQAYTARVMLLELAALLAEEIGN